MKNLSILSLELSFFIANSLRKTKECIYSTVYFTLTITNSKTVTKELLGPADLTRAQILCVYELSELIMVSEHKNPMFVALQVVRLGFKGFNNS